MSARLGLLSFAAAAAAVLASGFLVAAAVGVSVLGDPRPALEGAGATGAALGVALLVADALLPVPSSLVMISLGALYGAFVGGVLAFAGRFGMAVLGLAVGRAGAPVLTKLIGRGRRRHADALVSRWGAFALIVSRPVPLLAETVVLTAGASRMPWRKALPAAAVGSIPEAVVYAALGGAAATAAEGALVWLGFLLVGTLFRLAELAHRRASQRASPAMATTSAPSGR